MIKVKFNDTEQEYNITLFRQVGNVVIISGKKLPQDNTSGFRLIDGDGTAGDYSEYTTKYNVLTKIKDTIFLSTSESIVETVDDPVMRLCYEPKPEDIHEDIDPLTNEELTECVADLMYEMSLTQLGMMGGE